MLSEEIRRGWKKRKKNANSFEMTGKVGDSSKFTLKV